MSVQFALIRMETKQFAMFPEKAQSNQFNVETEFQFAVSEDKTNIRCLGTFTYTDQEQMVLFCEVGCYFAIKPESWEEMKTEDGGFVIPNGFLQHMATILVGAARGVLFCKTEGTKLQNFVLPLLDLTHVITGGMSVK